MVVEEDRDVGQDRGCNRDQDGQKKLAATVAEKKQ
jgi:hypothetical protein